jgi:hypothetical protein
MISDGKIAEDRYSGRHKAGAPTMRRRLDKGRVRRSHEKFPRPLRLALWLGLPIVLWSAIYFAITSLG